MNEIERLSPAWQKLFKNGQIDSQQKLASEAHISPATVNRLVNGQGRPTAQTVRSVAGVLTNGETDPVWAAVGSGHRDYGDFDLGEVAEDLPLLTPAQRRALLAMVRAMIDPSGKRKFRELSGDASDVDLSGGRSAQ